jgi:hypothetical protein
VNGWRDCAEGQREAIRAALDPERTLPEADFARIMRRLKGLARSYCISVDEANRNQKASEALCKAAAQARSLRETLGECRDRYGFPARLLYEQLDLADLAAKMDAIQEEIRPGGRIDQIAASLSRGTGAPRKEASSHFVWELADLWEASTGTRATCYPSSYHEGGYGGAFLAFARACILPVDPECKDSLIQKAVEARRKRGEGKATA